MRDLDPGYVADLARRVFGEPNRQLTTARVLRFGRRGSVAVVPSRGVFSDFESGASGGVLAMLVHGGAATSAADAARLLENAGAIAPRETAQERGERERREKASEERRRAVAASLWASAEPLRGSLAETYLTKARAIGAPPGGGSIGFIPRAPVNPYRADGGERRPAMVAAVVNAAGDVSGAHLTFLAADGNGKATDLAPSRKMVGTVGGCFVPLVRGSRLVVAEGIESALSAWEALGGPMAGLGCVAALSANGMARLQWPSLARELIIAPDREPSGAGENAAQTLAGRAWAAGLNVGFLRPLEGFSDWNDAAQAHRGRP